MCTSSRHGLSFRFHDYIPALKERFAHCRLTIARHCTAVTLPRLGQNVLTMNFVAKNTAFNDLLALQESNVEQVCGC